MEFSDRASSEFCLKELRALFGIEVVVAVGCDLDPGKGIARSAPYYGSSLFGYVLKIWSESNLKWVLSMKSYYGQYGQSEEPDFFHSGSGSICKLQQGIVLQI